MPLFMDFHKIENITVEDVINAHMADLQVQEKYGVKYHQFWVNQKAGTVFCLTEGPDARTCELVHQMAHGNVACAITEVEPGYYNLLMGEKQIVEHGLVKNNDGTPDAGYRTLLVTSVRTRKNDNDDVSELLHVPEVALQIITDAMHRFNGRRVLWNPSDNIVGVFNDVTDAIEAARSIQSHLREDSPDVVFTIGISADQPVNENGEFFSRAIRLAQHLSISAEMNQIVASSMVSEISEKKYPSIRYLNHSDEEFLLVLLDLTETNLSNKEFTVASLCRSIGISRPQLYRRVTELTGRAPNDLLRDLRMIKALRLLKQRSHNIAQIALEVGYNNPSYFSKCFSSKFGCSPSQLTVKEVI